MRTPRVSIERVEHELARARAARRSGAPDAVATAWIALERGHVLSQASPWPHLRVHLAMLRLALVTGNLRELVGQLGRSLVAAPSSALGLAPLGNRGTTRVGAFTSEPIPADLAAILAGPTRPS